MRKENSEFRIQNSEFRIQNPEDRIQKTESRRQNPEDRRQKIAKEVVSCEFASANLPTARWRVAGGEKEGREEK